MVQDWTELSDIQILDKLKELAGITDKPKKNKPKKQAKRSAAAPEPSTPAKVVTQAPPAKKPKPSLAPQAANYSTRRNICVQWSSNSCHLDCFLMALAASFNFNPQNLQVLIF
jgi:hypothetical protein